MPARSAAARIVSPGNLTKRRPPGSRPTDPHHGDRTVLHRLAQVLEHVARKLGQLVEEEHPPGGEGNLSRPRRCPSADEARCADTVMRRTERPALDEAAAGLRKAGSGVDPGELEGLRAGRPGRDRRQAAREQGLARPGGAEEQQGGRAGGRAGEGPARGALARGRGRHVTPGSDGPESAAREIALFFDESQLFGHERDIDRWVFEGGS